MRETTPYTIPSFEDGLEHFRAATVAEMLERGELRFAKMVLWARDKSALVAVDMPPYEVNRVVYFAALGVKFAKEHASGPVIQAYFCAEVWTVHRDGDAAKSMVGQVKDQADKEEAVYVETWRRRAAESSTLVWSIVRDTNGKVLDLARRPETDFSDLKWSLLKAFVGAYHFTLYGGKVAP